MRRINKSNISTHIRTSFIMIMMLIKINNKAIIMLIIKITLIREGTRMHLFINNNSKMNMKLLMMNLVVSITNQETQ